MAEVNQLRFEVSVARPRIPMARDLEVHAVLTNAGPQPIQLNGAAFPYAQLLLRVRKRDGTPIPFGPPPVPEGDDGKIHRILLAPGQSQTVRRGARHAHPRSAQGRGDGPLRLIPAR